MIRWPSGGTFCWQACLRRVPSQDPEGTVGSVNLLGTARSLLARNKGAAKTGVDKAGDAVDKKTDGKYTGQVDTAQDKAKDFIDKPDNPPESRARTTRKDQPPKRSEPRRNRRTRASNDQVSVRCPRQCSRTVAGSDPSLRTLVPGTARRGYRMDS
jgi:hypothetical protein